MSPTSEFPSSVLAEEKMLTVTLIGFVAVAVASGDPLPKPAYPQIGLNPLTPQGRIVGGKPTAIEEHPWQVSLQSYGFHFCGGSIISQDTILTAAHCTSYPPELISIRVGSSRVDGGGSVHEVREVVRHEAFTTSIYGIPQNDVAVIKLKTPIVLGNNAQPIPLFNQDEEAVEGVLSTISGWGALLENGDTPDILYTVDVPIVTKSECSKAYTMWGGIPDGQICAAFPAGGKDTCQGDSGGPLVIAGRQAGIVSWGNGCARKGYPGVYTEVASFRNWLVEHAGV